MKLSWQRQGQEPWCINSFKWHLLSVVCKTLCYNLIQQMAWSLSLRNMLFTEWFPGETWGCDSKQQCYFSLSIMNIGKKVRTIQNLFTYSCVQWLFTEYLLCVRHSYRCCKYSNEISRPASLSQQTCILGEGESQ